MMMSRIGSKGFTLIEVLVASVILFAGLGAVLKAYSLAVVAMELAADKLALCQIVQEKTAEFELQAPNAGAVLPSGEGRQRVGGFEYLWRVQAVRQVLTPQVSVLRIVLDVNRANSAQGISCVSEWTQYQAKDPAR